MTDLDGIEFKIAKLGLGPDDVLVLRFKQILSDTTHKRARNYIQSIIGDQKLMILDGGIDLAILTAAEIKERLSDDESEIAP